MRVKTVGFSGICFTFPRNTALLQNSKMFAFHVTVSTVKFGFSLLHKLPSVISTANNAEAARSLPWHSGSCSILIRDLVNLANIQVLSFSFVLSMSVIRCEWTRNTVIAQKSPECVNRTAWIHQSRAAARRSRREPALWRKGGLRLAVCNGWLAVESSFSCKITTEKAVERYWLFMNDEMHLLFTVWVSSV